MKHVVRSVISHFAAVAIFASAGYAHAELLVYESFEQSAPGALNAQTSGDGFAGAYSDNGTCSVVVESANRMVYQNGDISIDGGTTHMRMQLKSAISKGAVLWGRAIDTITATENNDPIYISLLMRVSPSCAADDDEDSFLFGITTEISKAPIYGVNFAKSSEGSGNAIGMREYNTNMPGSTKVIAGQTYLVVYKWYKTNGYYRGFSMVLNPSSSEEPSTWDIDVDSGLNKRLAEYLAISCFVRESCETEDQFDIDEFRIGRSWADVTGAATYNGVVPRPEISVEEGETTRTVTISQGMTGVSCYYTLDGTTPSASNGTLYTAPFVIGGSTDIKAVAVDSNGHSSEVVIEVLNIGERHWTGLGEDDNWSTPENWFPVGSPQNQVIVFGAQDRTAWGTVNNVIDEDITVRSLCFTNNNFAPAVTTAGCDSHVGTIAPGKKLKVVSMDDDGYSLLMTSPRGKWSKNSHIQASFGGGGAFEIDSPLSTAYLSCNSSEAYTTTTMDLTGLSSVQMNVSRIYVGHLARMRAYLNLSKSGVNTLAADVITVGDSHGASDAPSDASKIVLGKTNYINADFVGIGSSEIGFINVDSGAVEFAEGIDSPTIKIRSKDGIGRAEVRVGGHGQGGDVGQKSSCKGTLDLSRGSVDALIDELHVTRACGRRYDGSNNGGRTDGEVKLSAGVMDINNLHLVYSVYHSKSSDPSCLLATGEIDVSGGDFIVNGDADCANNNNKACQGVTATVNLTGGTMSVGGDMFLASRHGYATNVIANVNVSAGELSVAGALVGGTDDKNYTGNYTAEKVNVSANVTAAGGVIAVTNEQGTAELRIESGTLALQGGKVYADSLVLTNAASAVEVLLSGDGFATVEVGKALLGGTIKVSVADGFKPHGASEWTIVDGTLPRVGVFAAVELPEGYKVKYTPTGFMVANKSGLTIIVR